MADATLTTRVSRRAMLGVVALATGGGSAAASPLTLPSPSAGQVGAAGRGRAAKAALGGEGSIAGEASDPDAKLLRLMAVARRRRVEFNAARQEKLRLFRAMVCEPDYPRQPAAAALTNEQRAKRAELADRGGYRAAMALRDRAQDAYIAAARDAFAIPPRTLTGLYAKLCFAARASHEADNGNYEYGDNIWLDIAVADLRRLAAGVAA